MEAPPSWPNHLPKASSTNTITLGIRVSTYDLAGGGEYRNMQSITISLPLKCQSLKLNKRKRIQQLTLESWGLFLSKWQPLESLA